MATKRAHAAVLHALDEAKFGPARTLDLRSGLPSVGDAVRRAEPWLRERQMARAGDVLIVTGRGRGSPGGVAAIKPAIDALLSRLKRTGVVAMVRAHTPGSVVVSLAPIRALFEPKPRLRHATPTLRPAAPAELTTLDPATRDELRLLATYSLRQLGAPTDERFIRDEMLRQFSVLAQAIAPDETDRDLRFRFLVSAARAAFEDDA